jgi:urease accessory protein
VSLDLAAGPNGTCLAGCYQQVPLRVLPPFHFGPGQPALLYLLNPTAGLLDGDGHLVRLRAGSGTWTVVVGQSANRIHPSVSGFSTQQWEVKVASGAVLVVLPGPTIPFRGCRYYQRVRIDLAQGARMVWADLWLAGRYARGSASEQFQFDTLVQDFTVHRNGVPVFRDRFCWKGPWDDLTAAWHFGGQPASGSLFLTGSVEEDGLASPSVERAILKTGEGDTCLRWQGPAEAVTRGVVDLALRAGAFLATGKWDSPWMLGTYELAPNHWFSHPEEGRRLTRGG